MLYIYKIVEAYFVIFVALIHMAYSSINHMIFIQLHLLMWIRLSALKVVNPSPAMPSFVGPNIISWKLKKQLNVSKRSTKCEYCALAYVVVEVLWLWQLISNIICTHQALSLFVLTILMQCTLLWTQLNMTTTNTLLLTIILFESVLLPVAIFFCIVPRPCLLFGPIFNRFTTDKDP